MRLMTGEVHLLLRRPILYCTCLPACSVIPGGLTGERKVDPNDSIGNQVLQITKELWSTAEEMAGRKFDKFIAVSYRSQVVAGVNYFIKVRTS